MLSVYLDTFEQAIAFQVSDLSPKITDYIKNIGGTFSARNGWEVKVGEYTELDIARRTIFLPNVNNSQNPLRVDRKWDLGSDYSRDRYIKEASEALQELVDAESTPKYTPKNIGLKMWNSFLSSKVNSTGANHSSKPLIRY
jgi:hypothetical protein